MPDQKSTGSRKVTELSRRLLLVRYGNATNSSCLPLRSVTDLTDGGPNSDAFQQFSVVKEKIIAKIPDNISFSQVSVAKML